METGNKDQKTIEELANEIITPEERKVIYDYLATRLGMPSLRHTFHVENITTRKDVVTCESDLIIARKDRIGIFAFHIRDYLIKINIYPEVVEKLGVIGYGITVDMYYHHIDGGQNGHSLGITLRLDRDGKVLTEG